VICLLTCASGCGLFGSGTQLKQLQLENDRLLSEYRSQRERLAALQETNAALEARVGEAEKLLAQAGKALPSSRISRAPQRRSASESPAANQRSAADSANGGTTPPKYVPPSVPSLPGSADSNPAAADSEVQWQPVRRQ
jgi:hypothetical protein